MLLDVQHSDERHQLAVQAIAMIDPVGLVAMGFPHDEYAPEIDRLIPLAPVSAEQVRSVWLDMFGEYTGSLTDEQAAQIAAAINAE